MPAIYIRITSVFVDITSQTKNPNLFNNANVINTCKCVIGRIFQKVFVGFSLQFANELSNLEHDKKLKKDNCLLH